VTVTLLKGRKLKVISDALRATFTVDDLVELFKFRLERSLDDITLDRNYRTLMLKVVDAANREGWLDELIARAVEAQPQAPALQEMAAQLEVIRDVPTRSALEALLAEHEQLTDIDEWYRRLGELSGQVCRIEIGDAGVGTGFLVGPSAVITNHHVVQPIFDGEAEPQDVVLRFDYKRPRSGAPVHAGTPHVLAQEWLIDASPPAPAELAGAGPSPTPEQLDYALLRADGNLAEEPVGGPTEALDPPLRGWMKPARNPGFRSRTAA
jgi:hypothetical protein